MSITGRLTERFLNLIRVADNSSKRLPIEGDVIKINLVNPEVNEDGSVVSYHVQKTDKRMGLKEQLLEAKKGHPFWNKIKEQIGEKNLYSELIEAFIQYDNSRRNHEVMISIKQNTGLLNVKLLKHIELTPNVVNMLREEFLKVLKSNYHIEIPDIEEGWNSSQNKPEAFWTNLQEQLSKQTVKSKEDVYGQIQYFKEYDAGERGLKVRSGIEDLSNRFGFKLIEDENGEFTNSSVNVLREMFIRRLETSEGLKIPKENTRNEIVPGRS